MRSDQQIREEVQETLDQDPKISARDIAVAVRNGAAAAPGIVKVENRIEVVT
jgi:osmotically-inducible protein OsmY